MSIPLLPEFDADGYQVNPSTEKVNEIIAAINSGGGAIALLPTFAANGHQVEPSTDKINEIIAELNADGGAVALLPTFAANGYQGEVTVEKLNEVIVATESYGTGGEIVPESFAVSGNYPGEVFLPSGIQAGDLLLALVRWENDPAVPIDGFTQIDVAGSSFGWNVTQYRVADGNEGASIVPADSWAIAAAVVVRLSGVNAADAINASGAPEQVGGASATSKSVDVDSISTDAAPTGLVTLSIALTANTPTSFTCQSSPFGFSELGETYAGGATYEALDASGATGTRTCAATTAMANVDRIIAAMVALNPA